MGIVVLSGDCSAFLTSKSNSVRSMRLPANHLRRQIAVIGREESGREYFVNKSTLNVNLRA
ncbi:MAG: hypothetical protein KDI71_03840 [Xanthomonadales bacterium]|nr:hypothetical protein [Xanthomonadales bacterium]